MALGQSDRIEADKVVANNLELLSNGGTSWPVALASDHQGASCLFLCILHGQGLLTVEHARLILSLGGDLRLGSDHLVAPTTVVQIC